MKLLKKLLPHISLAFNIALMIVVYLDRRNPMMGFLLGTPFVTLAAFTAASSIATALMACFGGDRGKKSRREHQKEQKIENNT